ncbi:tfdA family oxidoreductase [Diplocarpon mali]|nr:tfdA family oxidoreductase [Diplocarpon mali]
MPPPTHHILLLGGTGICGTLFTRAALDAGHTLTLYVRTPSKIPSDISSHTKLRVIQGTFEDGEGLQKAAACGATVFVSFAGPTLGEKKGTPITKALQVLYPLLLQQSYTRILTLSTPSYSAPEDTRSLKWWAAINLYIRVFGGDSYDEIRRIAEATVALEESVRWTVFRVPLLSGTELGTGEGDVNACYVGDAKGRDGLSLERARLVRLPEASATARETQVRIRRRIESTGRFSGAATGPSGLGGEGWTDERQWTLILNESQLLEVEDALRSCKSLNKSAGLINQRTFPLPTLSPILRQHAKELWSGRGSFILRVKRSQYSREDNATIYAGVSSYIGPIRGRQVSKVVDGVKQSSMLNHIKDLSQTAAAGHLGASAYTTDKKVFQNDAGDIVSLFSLGVAAKDGESKLASSWRVYDELARNRPDIIKAWSEDWTFDGPSTSFGPASLTSPERVTIQYARRGFTAFLHLSRSPGIPPIAEAQAEVLDPLQFLGLKSSLTLNFKEGDIQYVNNLRSPMPGWLHGYRGAAEASVATLGETRNKPERRNRLCRADGMILMKVLRRRNRLASDDWRAARTCTIHQLHQKYGPVVRLGLNEVSLNSPTALKSIHGAGSGFERTSFYRMFDGHGQQKLFTFAGVKEHGERKKPLNHAYSKTSIQKPAAAAVGEKGGEFLRFLEREPQAASETFSSLHHYSLDTITHFLYGPGHHPFPLWTWYRSDKVDGGIRPGPGNSERRAGPIAAETGLLCEKVVAYLVLLPPKKPTVYTGIRKHALQSFHKHSAVSADGHGALGSTSITARVMQSHVSVKENGLNELEIASEVADHSLAGLDTTSDSLMFLIWALSLPENSQFQD